MESTFLNLRAFALICATLFLSNAVYAQSLNSSNEQKHYLIAQSDPDEAYDPFTDYSEFDEDSDEEADINFFRNGRFFTVGFAGGVRGFTGNFSSVYQSAPSYGLFVSYFFDLRLALQVGFQTGDHNVNFYTLDQTNGGRTQYTGNVSLTTLNFDLKYYLSTQNLTRGLASINPYIIGGFAQFYRTYTIAGLDGYSRDSTMGIDMGVGVEIPLMRKKAYLGLQAMYHHVNFNDSNKSYLQGTQKLEKNINGGIYDGLVIIGLNF